MLEAVTMSDRICDISRRFAPDFGPMEMPGHSVPLAALGGFILFFGFVAFNGGSQGWTDADGPDSMAKAWLEFPLDKLKRHRRTYFLFFEDPKKNQAECIRQRIN